MATASTPFYVKALYQYSTEYEEDLHFDVGQLITVSEIEDEEWYSGYYEQDGVRKEGIFPKNFVAVIDTPGEASQHTKEQPAPVEDLKAEVEGKTNIEPEQEEVEEVLPEQQDSEPEEEQEQEQEQEPKLHEKEDSAKLENKPIDLPKPKAVTSEPVPASDKVENTSTSHVPKHHSGTQNEMFNRISTFNHGTVAPMPTKGPVNEAPVKKSFIAAPSSYVPPGFGDKAKPKPTPQQDHPANLVSEHSQSQEEEEGPKMSLKERIALLQQRQQEEAERAQAVLKRKQQKKKKKEQQHIQAVEHQETAAELTEGDLDLKSQTSDVPEASKQSDVVDSVSLAGQEDATSIEQQGVHVVQKQTTRSSFATEIDDNQDNNEELESEQGHMTDDEIANKANDYDQSQDEVEETKGDDDEDEEGEEEDEEEVKRRNLRERMAKLSGGVGMFGMMGVPSPFGAPAASKTAPKHERKVSKSEQEKPDTTGSKSDSFSSTTAPQTVQPHDNDNNPSDESELEDESDEATSEAEAMAIEEKDEPSLVSSHPPAPISASQVPLQTSKSTVLESELDTVTDAKKLPPLHTQSNSKEKHEAESPLSPSVPLTEAPSIPKRTVTSSGTHGAPPVPSGPASPKTHRAPPVPPIPASPETHRAPPIPPIPVSPDTHRAPPVPPNADASQDISSPAQRRFSEESNRSVSKVPFAGAPPIPSSAFIDPSTAMAESYAPPDILKQTISGASEAPPLLDFIPEAVNQNFNHEHHSPEDSDNNVTGYEADEDTDVNKSPSRMATRPSIPIPVPDIRKTQTEINQLKDPQIGRRQTLPPAAPAPPIPGFAPSVPPPQVPSRVKKEAPPPPPAVPAPGSSPVAAESPSTTVKAAPVALNPIERRRSSVLSATHSNKFTDQTWYVKGRAPPGFSARVHDDVLVEFDTNTIKRRGNRSTIYRDFYVLSFDLSQDVFEVEWEENLPEQAETKHHRIDAPDFTVETLVWNSQEYGSKVFQSAHSFLGKQLDGSLAETIYSQIGGILPPIGVKGYGATIYKNNSNSSVNQTDEFRPGDVLCMLKAKFVAHKLKPAFEVGNKTEPYSGIIAEFDTHKNKLRVIEQDNRGKVKTGSYRLSDFKSGKIRVFRPIGRDAIGW